MSLPVIGRCVPGSKNNNNNNNSYELSFVVCVTERGVHNNGMSRKAVNINRSQCNCESRQRM
jgi:hypothetical protein